MLQRLAAWPCVIPPPPPPASACSPLARDHSVTQASSCLYPVIPLPALLYPVSCGAPESDAQKRFRANPELREATSAVPVSKKRPPASCLSPEPSTPSHNFLSPGHLLSHLRTELRELRVANLSSLGPRALPSPPAPGLVRVRWPRGPWAPLGSLTSHGVAAVLLRVVMKLPARTPENPKIPLSTREEGGLRRAAPPREASL